MDGGNADFAGAKICLTRVNRHIQKSPPLSRRITLLDIPRWKKDWSGIDSKSLVGFLTLQAPRRSQRFRVGRTGGWTAMDGGNADFAGVKICLTRLNRHIQKSPPLARRAFLYMAVKEGFEPSIPVKVCTLSRGVVSATHPLHHTLLRS
jgi:hypothetical protein